MGRTKISSRGQEELLASCEATHPKTGEKNPRQKGICDPNQMKRDWITTCACSLALFETAYVGAYFLLVRPATIVAIADQWWAHADYHGLFSCGFQAAQHWTGRFSTLEMVGEPGGISDKSDNSDYF